MGSRFRADKLRLTVNLKPGTTKDCDIMFMPENEENKIIEPFAKTGDGIKIFISENISSEEISAENCETSDDKHKKIDEISVPPVEFDNSYERNIIAVGGGKGGVGKTIVTANLATGLAKAGKQVIVVDLDFGGPNLHTCFGFRKLPQGLYDFLIRNQMSLEDAACSTKIPGLKIIGISEDYPDAADIRFDRRLILINSLKQLNADYILLDLGSGTTSNVIDFFCMADQGFMVSSPQITSVLNSYNFLKNVLFRKMDRYFEKKGKEALRKIVQKAANPENDLQIKRVAELEKELNRIDPEAGELMASIKEQFKTKLILNMVKETKEEMIGNSLVKIAKKHLDIDIDFVGSILYDNAVEESVVKMTPMLLNSPGSHSSYCFKSIVDKVCV